ncbi:hypothetical protein SAMN02745975_00854 [Geosporobacter subterraneus DSM 17957]|uniref:Lipoprotein n=1 Tax=Geosporobacter subterraneus DSM 17957 TaxID=1121919 RepID=A0A1M6EW90_9FIRM|nr:hypothetical protein [Geosporobacter subterraneus]SHI89757.1 hypothetical protein SAMN02745975_00854 [Geosporobacter subterraneus DSM 17957]
MKNAITLSILGLLSISLLFTACGKTDASVDQPAQTNPETQSQQAANPQGSNDQNNRPQFQRPDLYGRVKSIIGNEVLLELAEMPERSSGTSPGDGASPGGVRQSGGGGAMTAGGAMPAIPGGGGGPMLSGSGQQRTARALNLTGETKTILIPVGIPIISFGQNTQKELDLADIYQGMMMQIWLDPNDKEMITQVRVMQGR